MARSRCGSLHLHRTTLSFASSCRLDAVYIVSLEVIATALLKITVLTHRVGATTRHPQRVAVQLSDVYVCEHKSVEGDGRSAFTGVNRRKRGFG
jgi:hypothetical protein